MNEYQAPLGHIAYDCVPKVQAQMKDDGVEEAIMKFNDLQIPIHVNSLPRDISIIQSLMHELRWFESRTGKKAFDR